MKRITTSAAIAVLFACSAVLTAQTSSTDKPTPPTSTQGAAAQSGSTTRGTQGSTTTPQTRSTTRENQGSTTQTQTGSTARENGTQTSRPQRRVARNTRSSEANPPQEITLTGCLQANEQAASAPTAGSNATRRAQSNAVPTFILANANQGSGASSSGSQSVGPTGTSGAVRNAPSSTGNAQPSTSGASASAAGSSSYTLYGYDLSRQTGQQVEVKGMMMPAPSARSGRNRATGTSGSNDTTSPMPRIRVTSVKMLSEHCSNQ